MRRDYITLEQKCFWLSLKLSAADVLSQRRQQSILQTWSSDAEASVMHQVMMCAVLLSSLSVNCDWLLHMWNCVVIGCWLSLWNVIGHCVCMSMMWWVSDYYGETLLVTVCVGVRCDWLIDGSSGLLRGLPARRWNNPLWHVSEGLSPCLSWTGAWTGTGGQMELSALCECYFCDTDLT